MFFVFSAIVIPDCAIEILHEKKRIAHRIHVLLDLRDWKSIFIRIGLSNKLINN
jgi:hypothetical protein